MKKETRCLNHQCEECGNKLYPKWSNWFNIVFCSFIIVLMFLFSWLQDKQLKSLSIQCYERHYLSGRGTDLEVLKNIDIKCPKK